MKDKSKAKAIIDKYDNKIKFGDCNAYFFIPNVKNVGGSTKTTIRKKPIEEKKISYEKANLAFFIRDNNLSPEDIQKWLKTLKIKFNGIKLVPNKNGVGTTVFVYLENREEARSLVEKNNKSPVYYNGLDVCFFMSANCLNDIEEFVEENDNCDLAVCVVGIKYEKTQMDEWLKSKFDYKYSRYCYKNDNTTLFVVLKDPTKAADIINEYNGRIKLGGHNTIFFVPDNRNPYYEANDNEEYEDIDSFEYS